MYRYIHTRSCGIYKFCKYRSLALCLRSMNMSIPLHGFFFNTTLVIDLFEYQCHDCKFLLKTLGDHFFDESILFGLYLPESDKKSWIGYCCQLMLMFSSIRNFFGKNAVIKSCKVLVEGCLDDKYFLLRYWSCQTTMGHKHFAMEHYFRQAMKISYVQTVHQWSRVE